ncbi:MAG TPA: hypothetical protein GX526_03665 [Thermoanaerobacterales bacterium]|nr:hypothetical protein [Thermoanaerobacterales bacterium]
MAKTVIGVFSSEDQAESAVNEMRDSGFNDEEISIVAKDSSQQENLEQDDTTMGMDFRGGTTTGGVLGGLAGLALGAGALTIPGLGPIIAMGPIAGMLSGAAIGGVTGGLVDWGVPEDRGKHYEEKVKEGHILTAVRTDDRKVDKAADILRENGASDVETH